jgi:hypothetical protein
VDDKLLGVDDGLPGMGGKLLGMEVPLKG